MPETKDIIEVEVQPEPIEDMPAPSMEVNKPQEPMEEQPKEEVEVVETVVNEPKAQEEQPKEEVKEETVQEEAPKEEVAKEEPKEEAPVEKVEKAEEQPKEVAENKPTKEQVSKQEKAKRIMIAMTSAYDPVAQMTTLALVNALGPDISSYSNQVPVVQPSWYETKDIYQNTVLPDPLGSYISVSSSLQMEKMVSQQYE